MTINLRKSGPKMGQTIRKASMLLMVLALGSALAACGQTDKGQQTGAGETQPPTEAQTEKVQVIATLFPQYDFAKAIGRDHAQVRLLMPPGTESHSYEPTPKDLVDIENADVFIYTSLAMEPWIEKLLTQIGPETLVVDASKGVTMLTADQLGLEAHEEGEEDDDHEGVDPHIWLDPANAGVMAQNVANGLIQAMPENQDDFAKALAQYQDDLLALDTDIMNTLGKYPDRSIVFAGHYAFGYFSKRYGLSYHSPYEGFSPDSEPSPQKIADMVDLMRSENQKVVYYEELIDPKIARIIASETDAEMVMLHAAHNVSKDDLASEITYIAIMKENLRKLEEGLKAHE